MLGVLTETSRMGKFIGLLVFLTNLSQMPMFVTEGKTQLISMPLWLILLVICFLKGYRPYFLGVLGVKVWFIIYVFILLLLGLVDSSYFNSQLPGPVLISFFVFTLSSCIGDQLTEKDIDAIFTSYILSTFIVGISVYFTYIVGSSWEGRGYLYQSKNSVCQIILSAWTIILLVKFKEKNFILRLFYIVVFLFFTYEIVMLKSRASLLGIPVIFLMTIRGGKILNTSRIYTVWFCITLLVVLILNPDLWDSFYNNVLLGGRDGDNVNDISSGRSDEWLNFGNEFFDSPIWGHGAMKRESLIITSMVEFGILGGIPLLMLSLQPLLYVKRTYKILKCNVSYWVLVALACTYWINGIFEQLAPFGPGTKCYFLWFMLGIVNSRVYTDDDNDEKQYNLN